MNNSSLPEIVAHADQAYAARAEITNVRESVALLRTTAAAANHYETAWRLSRALFFLGQQTSAASELAAGKDQLRSQEARNFHIAGAHAGRQTVRLRSEKVAGHFWAGVNLALLAGLESGLRAATHALQARRDLQGAIAIDATYHAAGPLRVLARLQHKSPRWLGGGKGQARANFERAIAIAPTNTVTRIYLAELLLEVGETRRARAELEGILSAPFDPDWAFEIKRDQLLAQEMLAQLPNLERSQ